MPPRLLPLTMAARESAAVLAALADVQAGKSRAEAAEAHGVAPSSITRAMRRRKLGPLPRGHRSERPEPVEPVRYHFADGTPLVP